MSKKIEEMTDSEICLSCMECCKQMYTPMPWVELDEIMRMKEFYKVRGAKKIVQINGRYWAVWPWKCPHLTRIGCDIYEKRPLVCREYDGRDDPIMKGTCKLPERKLIVLPGRGERV